MSVYGPIAIVDVSPENARPFSKNIATLLGVKPHPLDCSKFGDGETNILIGESIRGKDVYIFQSYQPEIGERLYELQMAISAAKSGGGARRITAVLPYCFGMRGERQTKPRQSVPLEVVIKSLSRMGFSSALSVGLHEDAITTMFGLLDIKLEHLAFEPLAAAYMIDVAEREGYPKIDIASPDIGGIKRARRARDIFTLYSRVKVRLIGGDKYRTGPDKAQIETFTGPVRGVPVFFYDDIGASLGTIADAVKLAQNKGAKEAYIILIHPVLAEGYQPKLEQLCKNPFVREIVFGNTIPMKGLALTDPKIKTIPLEPFMAAAIRNMNRDESMSNLHDPAHIREIYRPFALFSDKSYFIIGTNMPPSSNREKEKHSGKTSAHA